MGDVDIAQNPTNDDLAALLEEALTETDEELEKILHVTSILHNQTFIMQCDRDSLEMFRFCFTSFSLLVVPFILSIGIIYATAGWVKSGCMLQSALEKIISILFYVSSGIGLPFYIFSVRDLYLKGDKVKYHLTERVSAKESGPENADESKITLDVVDESLENMHQLQGQFRHISSHPISETSSEEQQVEEKSVEPTRFKTASVRGQASFNNNKIRLAEQQLFYLDSHESVTHISSDISLSDRSPKEKKLNKEMKLYPAKGKLLKIKNSSSSAIRTLSMSICSSEKEDSENLWMKHSFGL